MLGIGVVALAISSHTDANRRDGNPTTAASKPALQFDLRPPRLRHDAGDDQGECVLFDQDPLPHPSPSRTNEAKKSAYLWAMILCLLHAGDRGGKVGTSLFHITG